MNKPVLHSLWAAAAFAIINLAGCSSEESTVPTIQISEEEMASRLAAFASEPVESLITNTQAMEVGQILFGENCASCHQADGTGRMGVPDLTDQHWLFEGTAESIEQTIRVGRVGLMPEFGSVIGEVELGLLVSYVEYLAEPGAELSPTEQSGKVIYDLHCVECHAADGTGVANLGPNLTDDYWQWGGNMIQVRQSITVGRNAQCPAHGSQLSDAEVHLLTAYTLGLSS